MECNYNQTSYPIFVPVVKQMVPESISSYQHKIGDVITNFVFPSCSSYDENISVFLMLAVVGTITDGEVVEIRGVWL